MAPEPIAPASAGEEGYGAAQENPSRKMRTVTNNSCSTGDSSNSDGIDPALLSTIHHGAIHSSVWNIVSKTNSRCSVEMSRLHEIGQIQGCGSLLILEEVAKDSRFPSGLRIVGASTNVVTSLWINISSTNELREKDIGNVFPEEGVRTVQYLVSRQKRMDAPSNNHLSPRANRNVADIFLFSPKVHGELALARRQSLLANDSKDDGNEALSCTVSGSDTGLFLVEIEEKHGLYSGRVEPIAELLDVADLLGHVPVGSNPQASTRALADALMAQFTAFDRIMVYRFAPDDSGEVIHESIRPGSGLVPSYMGVHFPATDIPPKARDILKRVGLRFIADTSAPSVPIDLFHEHLAVVDLTMSALRAPSERNLAYLRNMGVKSSLVVAIIVGGDLWGLFSCHSYNRITIPTCEERVMVEMAVTITSSLILHHQRMEVARAAIALTRTMERFSNYSLVQSFLLAEHKNLLSVLKVDTIVLSRASKPPVVFGKKGTSLTPKECQNLLGEEESQHQVLFASLEGRGVAYFSVRYFVIAFVRGSVAHQVKWAGKSDPPLHDQETHHPRASLELCEEQSAAAFEPWSPATVDLLGMVRRGISSYMYAEVLPDDLQETFSQMSHELRTPFYGVMGSLELLQEGNSSMGAAERGEYIDAAVACGRSMLCTINTILALAEDRKDTEVVCRPFFASKPIHQTISAMKLMAVQSMVGLTKVVSARSEGSPKFAAHDEDADLHEVVGDERRIEQILQNLVNNAIKFTPCGGTVEISLLTFKSLEDIRDWWRIEADFFNANAWKMNSHDNACPEDWKMPGAGAAPYRTTQQWYVYCVSDTGIGVAKSDFSSIMKAYRQVSRGPGKAYQGSGLGLHVCESLVDVMRGGMGVASTFSPEGGRGGSGTLFAVALPLWRMVHQPMSAAGDNRNLQKVDADALDPEMGAAVAAITDNFPTWRCDGQAGAKSCGPHRTVAFLVVDDNTVNVRLTVRKIEMVFKHDPGSKIQVLSATSGLEALEMVTAVRTAMKRSFPTDVGVDENAAMKVLGGVFMDAHMPGMDGIECVRRIRLLEAERGWPPVPICGVTADITAAVRENFLRAGGFSVIPKPWGQGQMEEVCHAMLAQTLNGANGNKDGEVDEPEPEKLATADNNTLQKNDAETLSAEIAKAVATITGSQPDSSEPRKILAFLVVDDNKVNVKLTGRKIERVFKHSPGRVHVLSATSGLQALEVLAAVRAGDVRHDSTDVGVDSNGTAMVVGGVFMDLFMSGMDGIECTRRIRLAEAERGWPTVPVYGLTANVTTEVRERYRGVGGFDVIRKPSKDEILQGVCHAMLAQTLNGANGNKDGEVDKPEPARSAAVDGKISQKKDAVATELAKAVAAITGSQPDSSEPRKILAFLVVDDNKVNVKLTGRKIERVFKHSPGRVHVLSATSGLQALEVLAAVRAGDVRHDSTDVGVDSNGTAMVVGGVFMDLYMPGMDGIECTRRIRLLEAERGWPKVPICGLTADVTETVRERFLGAGSIDVISNPLREENVWEVCKAMLAEAFEGANWKEGSGFAAPESAGSATGDKIASQKKDAETLETELARAVAAITGSQRESSEPRKILAFLVVDDNTVKVRLAVRTIENMFKHIPGKIAVLSATSGTEALEVLTAVRNGDAKRSSADVGVDDRLATMVLGGVFMDLHMPGMDGIECTRRIRLLEAERGWPRAPVCGLTADVTEAVRGKFFRAGSFEVIPTAWEQGQMREMCRAMLATVLEGAKGEEIARVPEERG